jgi:hypothetical protein
MKAPDLRILNKNGHLKSGRQPTQAREFLEYPQDSREGARFALKNQDLLSRRLFLQGVSYYVVYQNTSQFVGGLGSQAGVSH